LFFLPTIRERPRRVQFLNDVKQKGAKLLVDNASVLLTAAGVVGTVSTAVLAGRGGIKAGRILEVHEDTLRRETDDPEAELQTLDKVKIVWPFFFTPALTGTATVAAIIMGHRVSAQKAAALAAAYGLAERNLSEYKEKVSEHLTGPKKEKLETELAKDQVARTPGHEKVVIIEGTDDSLCLDQYTGRYFKSNPEKIRRAVNASNAEVHQHGQVSLSHFYDELELAPTSWSDTVGWGMGEQIVVKYNYVEAPDGRPVLAIDFEKPPHLKYDEPYS
jgi:uncharacterized protein DUF6353